MAWPGPASTPALTLLPTVKGTLWGQKPPIVSRETKAQGTEAPGRLDWPQHTHTLAPPCAEVADWGGGARTQLPGIPVLYTPALGSPGGRFPAPPPGVTDFTLLGLPFTPKLSFGLSHLGKRTGQPRPTAKGLLISRARLTGLPRKPAHPCLPTKQVPSGPGDQGSAPAAP